MTYEKFETKRKKVQNMKFLLTAVNAKYIHSNPGIYSLRAYATSKNEELSSCVEIAEYTINNQLSDIVADIYKRKPDVVAFSCYIWNITYVKSIIEELHLVMPHVPVWLGGPEVTYDAKEILNSYPQVTGIMIGEGEETFHELVTLYKKLLEKDVCEEEFDSLLLQIKGLALKSGFTEKRELMDMNELPFLYNELDTFKNRIIYYESSRGCPFRCSYCLSSIDKKVRFRDLEIVKKELQFFLDHKVSQVKFVDRTFNCSHRHAMEIWRFIYENDNGMTNFHFEISADLINEEELELLAKMRPGAIQLEIGVQSVHEETIQAINRTMNLDRLKEVVKAVHKGQNIHQHLDLIAGLPYEDYKTFQNSFNEVYEMKPEQLQLGFLKVLKGSAMHEKAREYGINYIKRPPYEVLYSNWISYEEILKLKQVEQMVEIYYNSNQFTKTLPLLLKEFPSPFAFYEKLADYYEKEGLFVNTPSRIYRYEVLLAFINKDTEDNKDKDLLYRQALTMDVYLRENSKSRPEFAMDLFPYKENCRRFYHREEEERNFLKGYEEYDARQMAKMTHIEVFTYDLQTGLKLDSPKYMLFDYKNRSALTHEASVFDISSFIDV